jgi:Mrp family chromosome partitioning ATPase
MVIDEAVTGEEQRASSSIAHYLAVLRRRKWILLPALVLLPLAALAFSLRQEPLYQASAEVLISRQNLAAALTGVQDPSLGQQADRLSQTHAELARVPEVAERVLRTTDVADLSANDFLTSSTVSSKPNSDLLLFTVTDPVAADAIALASAYATAYADYRAELDTASIERAREGVRDRMDELERSGERRSALFASLADKEQQLRTLEALQTANVAVVRTATDATQVQPRPVRNVVLGLLLGLGLGVALAFLWEALDTRIRRAEEIERGLQIPLLARLAAPTRRMQKSSRLVMLGDPGGVNAEGFRMLRSNLEFVTLEHEVKVIMVTSAVQQEGKTTTVANLAVALARGGSRVVVVDLDLRRPFLGRFFDVSARPGLTEVVLGRAHLEDAIATIAVASTERVQATPLGLSRGNGDGELHGVLDVLHAGPLPPDPGEFVGTARLARLIARLREGADIVLIDAPPMLPVGDALTLSRLVDGIVVVARLGVLRRGMLAELARLLRTARARPLGFVITDAESDQDFEGYGYGHARGYGHSRKEKSGVEVLR